MKSRKYRVVVLRDGTVTVDGLPVQRGDVVDVTIRVEERRKPAFPLRGMPIRYVDPLLPVDADEWDADK